MFNTPNQILTEKFSSENFLPDIVEKLLTNMMYKIPVILHCATYISNKFITIRKEIENT